MNILILGASGFIGRNLLEYLIKDYHVISPTHNELDVLNEIELLTYLQTGNFDVVINALDDSNKDNNFFEHRLRMFCNLEKYSDLYGKMIYFGSGAEFDRSEPLINVSEEKFDQLIPIDTYGFCLHQMSKYTLSSDNIYNFRLFGIFGKYELWKSRFISNIICQGLFELPITINQNRIMDYLYIDDLCKIVEWAIKTTPKHHVYNATSGNRYELKELACLVNNKLEEKVPINIIKDGLQKEYTASNVLLMSEMSSFSIEPIDKSIEKLIKWYKQNIHLINKESLIIERM